MLKEYVLGEIENIHYFGRVLEKKSYHPMFSTGSGIEIYVESKELWIEVESDYVKYEPWISVLIDDAKTIRVPVLQGTQWIPLFMNLDSTIPRKVKIIKDTQAMSGDEKTFLRIKKIRMDGTFLKLEKKRLNIEFVGDSITSGEGASGAKKEMEWIPMVFSAVDNYATMTATDLEADYRIISQSGWGVLSSWDANPAFNIPDYYEKVCGFANGKENKLDGADQPYNFNSWQSDYVVVNLGTNDYSAFTQPALYYDREGKLFEQKMTKEGFFEKDSLKRLEDVIYSFLIMIRKNNPNAYIIWAYGMLGDELAMVINHVIYKFSMEQSDKHIHFLQLDAATSDTLGSREHPGIICHLQAKEKLSVFIRKLEDVKHSM